MQSMTGFGRAAFELNGRAYRLEIRTVNNRFLDLRIHMPWADGQIEQNLRKAVRKRLSRGRVQLSIDAADTAGDAGRRGADAAKLVELDHAYAQQLASTLVELAETVGCDLATAARLLPPQRELIAGGAVLDSETLWAGIEACLDAALDALLAMRRREGEALRADLAAHAARLAELVAEVAELADAEPQRRADRLKERLDKLVGDAQLSPERLAQEVALLADRCDVSEERTRLASHLSQLTEMLGAADPVGRRIEFMLQEVNRELNTIASKSGEARVAELVVEGKAVLEKMREQAQNVE